MIVTRSLVAGFCAGVAMAAAPLAAAAPDYADAVLADEPVAFYRFSETSGTDAADSAGSNDAVTVGGVDMAAKGPVGPDFEAANSAAGFARPDSTAVLVEGLASALEGAAGVSFSFWMDADLTDTAALENQTLVLLFLGVANDGGGGLTTGGTVGIRNQRIRVGGRSQASDGFQAGANLKLDARVDGQVHVAGVLNFAEGTIETYLDGTKVDGSAVDFGSTTFQPGPAASAIGAVINPAGETVNGFTGMLDEVAIFNVALTAEQVAAQHNAGTVAEPE